MPGQRLSTVCSNMSDKVYIIIKNYGYEGYAKPSAVFSNRKVAEKVLEVAESLDGTSMVEILEMDVITLKE